MQAALQLDARPALIVDIGGGSAQLVHVRGAQLLRVVGVPLGALRLTETRIEHDPPTEHELESLHRRVKKQLRAALETLGEPAPEVVYGSSGSIHALAGLAHWEAARPRPAAGEWSRAGAVGAGGSDAAARTHDARGARSACPGIDAARAEILVPGAIVLEQVLRLTGARSITLSDYGVREGLVTDWIKRHGQELSTLEAAGDLRLRSVLGLLARFDPDGRHPQHVAALSLRLFDEFAPWHQLGAQEREWLQFAALLHDLGSAIAYDGHAKHSAYAIRHGGLRGLTAEEIDIVASIARYHGGSRPRRKRDEVYGALPKRKRRAVRWLSAMLRVAEGLDRSHYQLVRGLRVRRRKDTFVLVADAGRHAQLELWAGRQRATDLARLLGHEVVVRPAASERVPATRARRDAPAASAATRSAALRVVAPAGGPVAPPSPRTRSAARDRSAAPASAASDAATPPAPTSPAANGHGKRPLALPRRNASA